MMGKRTKADPVFAQIARHRKAEARYGEVIERFDGEPKSARDKRDYERASRAEQAAMEAFLVPPPITLAGLRAALAYLAERDVAVRLGLDGGDFENPFIHLARSPALREREEAHS